MEKVVAELAGSWRAIALKPFRRTPGVSFAALPMEAFPFIDAIDRIVHEPGTVSPGPIEGADRPWHFHPYQEDCLLVLGGRLLIEIYSLDRRRIESFVVEPDRIELGGTILHEGPAMLAWPVKVFHRACAGTAGSSSLTFSRRLPGFDARTNFSAYGLDVATGDYKILRPGWMDQTPS